MIVVLWVDVVAIFDDIKTIIDDELLKVDRWLISSWRVLRCQSSLQSLGLGVRIIHVFQLSYREVP